MVGVWAWAWVGPCALCLLATSNIALAVVLPPQLSASDSRVVVMEGETSLVLQCNLEYGDNPIAYRWLKNQELVTGALGYAYRGLKQVSLALHAIEQQHAGVYTCEASNEAGVHTAFITVVVESTGGQSFDDTEIPHTDETLTAIATSLSDVLAEGDCHCDSLFLLHAAIDVPTETLAAQANLAHTMAENIISSTMRVGVMTYSDYVISKLSFGRGVDRCSLRDAFKDLSHDLWPTRIEPVFREIFKKFKKSKKPCKVLFLPIFGSLGTEGADIISAQHLKKLGVTIFILEVTAAPLPGVSDMASRRGDGQPYHWRVPLDIWPTIVINMKYMSEEIASCPTQEGDKPGKCVGINEECTSDAECRGIGFGCIEGICQFLECNINPRKPGCCSNSGHYWCGDVTSQCTGPNTICDGRVQCMNGEDEGRCWSQPCPSNKVARCQTSTLCLGLMDLCNGEPECPGGEDEDPRFCRSFPCPTNRPFRCRSGKCITTESLCDGSFKDCAEGEDEDLDYCNRVHTCPPTLPFKCDYGICYLDKVVCDGIYNCLDATDELNCKMKNCPADRPYKCTGSGLCIGMELVCNGVLDGCDDGSDERNCTEITCPVNRSYKCYSGLCISAWLACDGRDDCGDGSDENDCGEDSTTTIRPEELSCPVGQFKCLSGACIATERVCDGRRNCLNGDDERNCRMRLCPSTRPHRCQDGSCVQASAPCNGVRDCSDGSDETSCTNTNPAYTDEEFEEELEEEYEYGETEDYEEPPVLSTPSEAPPTTPPMKPTVEEEVMEVEEAEPEPEPEGEPETRLEEEEEPEDMAPPEKDIVLDESPAEGKEKSNMPSSSSENMENNEEVGDIEDMETILEEPGVQTAASSEKEMEKTPSGTCTTSLCASLVLAPLLVLSLSNIWMR